MNRVNLQLTRTAIKPGQRLDGELSWQFDKLPKSLSLHLFWFTRGRGTEDMRIIETKDITPTPRDMANFSFNLPAGPYSFSGRLITLTWGVELIDNSGHYHASETFTLSPVGEEIQL